MTRELSGNQPRIGIRKSVRFLCVTLVVGAVGFSLFSWAAQSEGERVQSFVDDFMEAWGRTGDLRALAPEYLHRSSLDYPCPIPWVDEDICGTLESEERQTFIGLTLNMSWMLSLHIATEHDDLSAISEAFEERFDYVPEVRDLLRGPLTGPPETVEEFRDRLPLMQQVNDLLLVHQREHPHPYRERRAVFNTSRFGTNEPRLVPPDLFPPDEFPPGLLPQGSPVYGAVHFPFRVLVAEEDDGFRILLLFPMVD